ncbi:hypothetical protein BpHYR1_041157 [Brachionus plicatilis]|uniref:C2 domain-containing protein n=1 Tax=Brachionus plicatilis TaxID=10195 RepID=A0A3M7P3I6_BRAPC|nr:hypothetical protein BpHYR1_041157 [Brachionus plicatilis]
MDKFISFNAHGKWVEIPKTVAISEQKLFKKAIKKTFIKSGKSEILKKSLLIYIENEDKISYYMNNLQTFVNDIKKFSKPTYELILNHLNYLNNNDFYINQTSSGSIYFKIGYEENKDSIKITIKIDCGRIVDSELDKFSYFIRLDLLPDYFFLQANIEKRTKLAAKQSSNKINFNQYFIINNIPNVVSKIDDASVRLSLWNKNKYGKEKCLGECFYPIKFIENMDKMVSINEMLAVNKNLRGHNDQEFDLLEELMRRKEFDREAKNFICLRQQLKEIDSIKCENKNKFF